MEINLVGFDVTLGRKKPRTLIRESDACPFCDVKNLTDIIDTDGTIILLRNKYNVIDGAEQFVLIESDLCKADMPDYSREHMRRLIRFGVRHWQKMLAAKNSRGEKKYEAVLFFKNYGPLSGGTIRHPHMQLVGFTKLNASLLFDRREFDGLTIAKKDGVTLSVATCPRIGFGELNVVPDKNASLDTAADFIQVSVDYLMKHFSANCRSYNIFFYNDGDDVFVKLMPRFATSPLFVGYNIRFLPNNLDVIADEMRGLYRDVFA